MSLTLLKELLRSRLGSWLSGRTHPRVLSETGNRRRSFALQVLLLEDRTTPTTFWVLNTNDSGADSLRRAILDSNANPGADIIAFSIADAGIHTINLESALPAIADAVTIA